MADQQPDVVGTLKHLRGAPVECFACGASLAVAQLTEAVEQWISGSDLVCGRCGKSIALFRSLAATVRDGVWLVPLSIAGAETITWRRPLIPMMFGVDLHALGVPAGARLLRVEWWTDDSSRPPEMPEFAGSVYVRGQNALPTPLRATADALMFGVAASQDQSFEGVDVVLYITWAQPGIERETGLLVRAFDAFIAGAIDDAIVPANTAVEIVVNRTVRDTGGCLGFC